MENSRVNSIAKNIIGIVKSVGKTKEYAISIICWYTYNEKEDLLVEQEILKIW